MKPDIFLKLEGIKGEARDARHRDEIEVRDWHWFACRSVDRYQGAERDTGKATVLDLLFRHEIDCATPHLTRYCLTGKPIGKATLTMHKAGGNPLPYFRMALNDVLVTHVAPDVKGVSGKTLEVVTLAFASIEQEYTIQSAQGSSAGVVRAAFDVKANREI